MLRALSISATPAPGWLAPQTPFSSAGIGDLGLWIRIAVRRARKLVRTQLRAARRLLALSAVAAALAALASPASAADCVNGYRTLDNNLILRCEAPIGSAAQYAIPEGASPEITGSLPAAVVSPPPAMAKPATNPADCQPGGYWYMPTEEAPQETIPMACK